jgi:hypothetical protein
MPVNHAVRACGRVKDYQQRNEPETQIERKNALHTVGSMQGAERLTACRH